MKYFDRSARVILYDLFMVVIAWELAWVTRFNFEIPFPNWQLSFFVVPIVVSIQGAIFWYFNLYRSLWNFVSLADLWNILCTAILGMLVLTLILFVGFRLEGIARSILLLYPMFLVLLLGGSRMMYRLCKDHYFSFRANSKNKKRVLVIGAGRSADLLLREFLRSNAYLPVAILDDDVSLHGLDVHGIKIYGKIEKILEVAKHLNVELIVIAVPSASSVQMDKILQICLQLIYQFALCQSMQDIIGDTVLLPSLREVNIEDLLGRATVELDWQEIRAGINNKKILVTGGGGSIGSELCVQIIQLAPTDLIIFERNEFNLYKIEKLLLALQLECNLHFVLGDLCDKDKIEYVISTYRPDLIFHGAAYKHVLILEQHPREAVRNNILATKNVADLAAQYDCERFVLISTDKAVQPSNILGVTKRIAELYIKSINTTSKTAFITVRFGNVLGSDGSVVPLFKDQIKQGGPVTVTDPEAARFFMTIKEACQLILQTGNMGQGGEIFVLDMGELVKIKYLAEQMIMLSSAGLAQDIEIVYTGLRPGEKLQEKLFYEYEVPHKTERGKVLLAKHNHGIDLVPITEQIAKLEKLCDLNDEVTLVQLLYRLTQDLEGKIQSMPT